MSKSEETQQQPAVGVLARAAAILDAVEAAPRTTAELAQLLGLSASTVYRLVGDMVRHSMLHRADDGSIHPGDRFKTTALTEVSRPVLTRLRMETGETAQLWLPRGSQRLCAVLVETHHELRAAVPAGTLLPLGAGSAGHVLNGDFEADPQAVAQGWWESTSERTPGLTSVSSPVRIDGRIVAAVCVAGPLGRVPTSASEMWGPAVRAAAEEIQHALTP